MTERIVVLDRFPDEASAWIARAVLQAGGIVSEVLVDRPYVWPLPVVRLAVRADDAAEARRLLEAQRDASA